MARKLSRMQQKAMFAKLRFNKTKLTIPPAPLVEKKQVMQARNKILTKLDNIPKHKIDKLSSKQKKQLVTAKKELKQVDSLIKFRVWRRKFGAELSSFGIGGVALGSGLVVAGSLSLGTGGLIVVPAAAGVLLGKHTNLESGKAENLLQNRKTAIKQLREQGFNKKQSKIILKNKILQLEQKTDRRIIASVERQIKQDKFREQKRIKRLLR